MEECKHKFCEIDKDILKCTECGEIEVTNEYNKLEPNNQIWMPENKGDYNKGVVKYIDDDMLYGKSYQIEKDNGKKWITPAHNFLQNLLTDIKVGDHIIIEYRGNKPTKKGNPLELYNVWVKI